MRIEALRGLRSLSYSQQGIKQRNPLFRKSFLRCAGRAVYDLWDGPALLSELTEEAGGRCYEIDNSRDLPAVAEKIGRELRHQYVLGYVPQNRHRDGRYRHIQVKIVRAPGQPRLSAYWRRGYYAPAD